MHSYDSQREIHMAIFLMMGKKRLQALARVRKIQTLNKKYSKNHSRLHTLAAFFDLGPRLNKFKKV